MANGKVTNDKIYDLINNVRLELKEDIREIKDQQGSFLGKDEYNRAHADLVNRVDVLATFINRNSPEALRNDFSTRLERLESGAEAYRVYQAQFEDAVDLAQWGRSMRANLKFLVPIALALVSAGAALLDSVVFKAFHK